MLTQLRKVQCFLHTCAETTDKSHDHKWWEITWGSDIKTLSKNIHFIWFLGDPKFELMTSLWRHLDNLHKLLYSFKKTIKSYWSIPNFKSISFKMAVLQGAGRICPPHVCVIQKTPCGIGLKSTLVYTQASDNLRVLQQGLTDSGLILLLLFCWQYRSFLSFKLIWN